jgi:two-component system sensor histidine kinase RpfC
LVAEDNPINQRVIRGLLEHAGHQTFLARDGEEALVELESDPGYDLAILDMHMPLLSGPEVLQRWRFMENGHLPVIMLTADARVEAKTACEDAGADAFLTKPINSGDLLEAIARLTGGQPRVQTKEAGGAQAVVLDQSILDDLAAVGGLAFVEDLLASFEEESARLMQDVECALTAQNYGHWLDQLHMLKGGASDIGACQLALCCSDAERIKPFELASQLAQSRLDAVRDALALTKVALSDYQSSKLRAEQS